LDAIAELIEGVAMRAASESQTLYECNPEVVIRVVDEDGVPLFNPDTNRVTHSQPGESPC
jgi:hypothetical protein